MKRVYSEANYFPSTLVISKMPIQLYETRLELTIRTSQHTAVGAQICQGLSRESKVDWVTIVKVTTASASAADWRYAMNLKSRYML